MALSFDEVDKPVRKLRKIIKNTSSEPSPDDVHDLRTNTRRLEAALAALSLESRRDGRRLLEDLTRVRRRAGKVRDLDVFTSYVASIHVDGEENCTVQLLEHLGGERRQKAKKLGAVISKRSKTLRQNLKRTSKDFERALCQSKDDNCDPRQAAAQATAAALKLESELATPARLGRDNLHPYRLKVKELRNVLRMAEDADNDDFLNTLGDVKDAIGEWHDWGELVAIAADVLEHGATCKLLRELKKRSAEKYEYALGQAEKMRTKYLRVSHGKRKRNQPAEPVWSAIASMAA